MDELEAARRIGVSLTRLLRATHRAKAHDAASGGAFHAMPLLWALSEAGPLRSNLLAETVLSDPSTISRQVTALVEQGFVVREPDPEDGRASLLAITDAGRAHVADRLRMRNEYLASMTASWTGEDRDRFAELFDRFTVDFAATVNRNQPRTTETTAPTRTEKS